MRDPVDDLIDKMAQQIAPDEPGRQEELKASWPANPKLMVDFAQNQAPLVARPEPAMKVIHTRLAIRL